MVRNVRALVKLVNQVLLLQDLHNTRMCNPLLEPETSEEIWLHEDTKGRSVYGECDGEFVACAVEVWWEVSRCDECVSWVYSEHGIYI